jgi:hypothetical protein
VTIRTTPPPDGTAEQRLKWLEEGVLALTEQADTTRDAVEAEQQAREAALTAERQAWKAEVGDTRRALADYAGGGLRIQAWGALSLLVGITLAAIPTELAGLAP